MIIISSWLIVFILLFIIIPFNMRNDFQLKRIIRKKKERRSVMPKDFMKEFIGKVCTIVLFNDSFGIKAKIIEVEDNWIKVDQKGNVRIINGDMIRDISVMPEKYQK